MMLHWLEFVIKEAYEVVQYSTLVFASSDFNSNSVDQLDCYLYRAFADVCVSAMR